MSKKTYNIRAKRDVFGVDNQGTVIKNNSGTVGIHPENLDKAPKEYAESLQAFTDQINLLLQKYQVPSEKSDAVQNSINELAEETTEITPGEQVGIVKANSIKHKIMKLTQGLVRLLPKGAEIASSFTPLSPFSKLIGEAVEELITAVQNEEKK